MSRTSGPIDAFLRQTGVAPGATAHPVAVSFGQWILIVLVAIAVAVATALAALFLLERGGPDAPPRPGPAGPPVVVSDWPELVEGEAQGEITADSPIQPMGSPHVTFRFEVDEGEEFEIYVRSAAIDPVIRVEHEPSGTRHDNDDFIGTNSYLRIRANRGGEWLLRVRDYNSGTGSFGTEFNREPLGPQPVPGGPGPVIPGPGIPQPVDPDAPRRPLPDGTSEATLGEDGERAHVWVFEAEAGEAISLTMQSGAFDTVLDVRLMDPDGGGVPHRWYNDDAFGTNSEVSFDAPADGSYLVTCSAYAGQGEGAYQLTLVRIDDDPPPPSGLPLAEGVTTGRLGGDDPRNEEGRICAFWDLEVDAGVTVRIRMHSADFEPMLWVETPHGRRLFGVLLGDGETTVLGTTSTSGGTWRVETGTWDDAGGEYRLEVAFLSRPPELPLDVGDVVIDLIDDPDTTRIPEDVAYAGALARCYRIDATAGDRVELTLTSNEDGRVDTVLVVTGPDGFAVSDDDGGGGTNSAIDFVAPADGTYLVWAAAIRGEGACTLRASRG